MKKLFTVSANHASPADIEVLDIDAFRATRVETANQFIYAEGLFIDKSRDGRTYSLILSNMEWSGVATAAYLERLESILWHMHYLPECHDDLMLSSDGEGVANLDSYIRGFCEANGYDCDGDAFGVMFSEKEEWSAGEALQQALATVRTYKLSPGSRFAAHMSEVERLALAFADSLKNELSHAEWRAMRVTNATPLYSHPQGPCASHDYCDANMIMAAAWKSVMGEDIDIGDDSSLALWNEAWSLAKRSLLSADDKPMHAPYSFRVSWNGCIVMCGHTSAVMAHGLIVSMLGEFAGETRRKAIVPPLEDILYLPEGESIEFYLNDETGTADIKIWR